MLGESFSEPITVVFAKEVCHWKTHRFHRPGTVTENGFATQVFSTDARKDSELNRDLQADLAAAHLNSGRIKSWLGEKSESIASFDSAISILTQVVEQASDQAGVTGQLADTFLSKGWTQVEMRESDGAIQSFQPAISLREQLASEASDAENVLINDADYVPEMADRNFMFHRGFQSCTTKQSLLITAAASTGELKTALLGRNR